MKPDDDDVVIRYGTMRDRDSLVMAARTTFIRRRYYGLSMISLPGMSAQAIAAVVAPRTRVTRGKMRSTRIGDLRSAGFEIADHSDDGHLNVRFPDAPNEETWERLEGIMGPAEAIRIGEPRGGEER